MRSLSKSTAADPVWKYPLTACLSSEKTVREASSFTDLLAYISDQESIIQAQSKLIQELSTKLALHEALEEGK